MESDFKCSKHQNKKAAYICTHSQCFEDKLCNLCVPNHSMHHLSRLLFLNDAFIEEDSLFNSTKKNQAKILDQIASILKENENLISLTLGEIENNIDNLIKEIIKIIQEFKLKIITDFKNSLRKENSIDIDRVNQIYKNLAQVKLEEESDILSAIKKIQLLEDDLLPSATKELKEIHIQNNLKEKNEEKIHLNPKFCEEVAEKFKIALNDTNLIGTIFSDGLKQLYNISFNRSIESPKNDLIISSEIKLPADIFHTFNKIIIQNGGKLSVDPWDGKKGGRLILICKQFMIQANGIIDISALGYFGGSPCESNCAPNQAFSGESYNGLGTKSKEPNKGGGGGGTQDGAYGSCGGGGGGYGTKGENSEPNTYTNGNRESGKGGEEYGDEEMTAVYLGSGGGAGAPYDGGQKAKGGNGGGVVVIMTDGFKSEGKIVADGGNGEDAIAQKNGSGGGGGSGGSIYIVASSLICKGELIVNGGIGGKKGIIATSCNGGKGGMGRIKFSNLNNLKKINITGI